MLALTVSCPSPSLVKFPNLPTNSDGSLVKKVKTLLWFQFSLPLKLPKSGQEARKTVSQQWAIDRESCWGSDLVIVGHFLPPLTRDFPPQQPAHHHLLRIHNT